MKLETAIHSIVALLAIAATAPAQQTGLSGSGFESDFASVFVHFGGAQTQTWLMVRLPSPEIPPGPALAFTA